MKIALIVFSLPEDMSGRFLSATDGSYIMVQKPGHFMKGQHRRLEPNNPLTVIKSNGTILTQQKTQITNTE
ncbi:hypothetical protein [Pontibacter silvestris]|uniref:hypothetical protein n=1 Tax=Pontibacter silvestris TaxID=2305183 RepID=UPI0036726368